MNNSHRFGHWLIGWNWDKQWYRNARNILIIMALFLMRRCQ
ncbi:hypothetical protein [cyanobacterium endosymbiont of Rhopalodia gibberula]|nr:hypothetical protein [cyanobacterium endosymbiont of Rhopalodia gibberula]